MKAFKKLTAFAVAMTMGCSVLAFTACNPDDGNDDKNPPANVLPSGTPAQAIDSSFASAIQEEKNYASINMSGVTSGEDKNYSKTNGVETPLETTTYEINMAINGKVDLSAGNADLVAKSVAEYESTDTEKDFSYQLESNNFASYLFMRDWNTFSFQTPDNTEEITDFTGVELKYGSSLKINWEEILGPILGGNGDISGQAETTEGAPEFDFSLLPQTGDLINLSLLGGNYALVKLAAATNTIETVEGGYSINLLKTVETVLKEVGSVIYALDGTNTVGDVLNNAIVKKYFSIITELVPVETVKDSVAELIEELKADEQIGALMLYFMSDLEEIKKITANDTYDYIVAVLSSENFKNVLNTVAMIAMQYPGNGATPTASDVTTNEVFTKTLDKYTVNEILTIVNATQPMPLTLEFLKNAYKTYIEPVCDGEKLYISTDADNPIAVTELKAEYAVESGKLASQKLNVAYEHKYTVGQDYPSSGEGNTSTRYYCDTTETQQVSIEVTYETSAPALADVTENPVTYSDYVWDEERTDYFSLFDEVENTYKYFYLGAWVEDEQNIGFKLYDSEKALLDYDSEYLTFYVGNDQYSIILKDKYVDSDGYEEYNYSVCNNKNEEVVNCFLTTKRVEKTSTVAQLLEQKAQ